MNKKAMSPLVATILLIAFVAALLVLVSNWVIESDDNLLCKNTDVTVTQFCLDDKSIVIEGTNNAESIPIEQLSLLLENHGTEYVIRVKQSSLEAGESFRYKIPLPQDAGETVVLMPMYGENPRLCEEFPLEKVDPIRPCRQDS